MPIHDFYILNSKIINYHRITDYHVEDTSAVQPVSHAVNVTLFVFNEMSSHGNKFGSLIVIVHFPQAQLVPVEGGNNTQSVSAAVANMYPFYTTAAVSSQPTS